MFFFYCYWLIITIALSSGAEKHSLQSKSYHKTEPAHQRFAIEPMDQSAVIGSKVTLPCRVLNQKGPIQWTKDDFGLGAVRNLTGYERYAMIGSDEEGDFSLMIYPVELEDDGIYQCQASPTSDGQPGLRSRFAKLSVLVPPKNPEITQAAQGNSIVTTEDRTVVLECTSAQGKPPAEITWIDGLGSVLHEGVTTKHIASDNGPLYTVKSTLIFTPRKEQDNTVITCQSQNAADRTPRSAKIKIKVRYAPKVSLKIQPSLKENEFIREGLNVKFKCSAEANPPIQEYKWYINDKTAIGDFGDELFLHNVTRDLHDAIVKCEVSNDVGKSEETKTLDVTSELMTAYIKSMTTWKNSTLQKAKNRTMQFPMQSVLAGEVCCSSMEPLKYAPKLRNELKSIETQFGSTEVLQCDVDGNPQPSIVWTFEDFERIVATSPNISILVTPETAGKYYCIAQVPGFPELRVHANIYIKAPPRIISKSVQYISGDGIPRVDCTAISIPKAISVKWSYFDETVALNSTVHHVNEEFTSDRVTSLLMLPNHPSSYFKKYNCTVINEYGNDTLTISLLKNDFVIFDMRFILVVAGVVICLTFTSFAVGFILHCRKSMKQSSLRSNQVTANCIHDASFSINVQENDQISNVSDIKIDIRASSCINNSENIVALESDENDSSKNIHLFALAGPDPNPITLLKYSTDCANPFYEKKNEKFNIDALNNIEEFPPQNLLKSQTIFETSDYGNKLHSSKLTIRDVNNSEMRIHQLASAADPQVLSTNENVYLRLSAAEHMRHAPHTAIPGITPAPPPYTQAIKMNNSGSSNNCYSQCTYIQPLSTHHVIGFNVESANAKRTSTLNSWATHV